MEDEQWVLLKKITEEVKDINKVAALETLLISLIYLSKKGYLNKPYKQIFNELLPEITGESNGKEIL